MKKSCLLAAPLFFFLVAGSGFAQSIDVLSTSATNAYEKKLYAKAASLFLKAAEREPENIDFAYNAAASYSMAGDKENAFKMLALAKKQSLLDTNSLANDIKFKALRSDQRWQALMLDFQSAAKQNALLWDSPSLTTPYRDNISEDEKVAGLSKLWSEVKFNFWNSARLVELDWDGLYLKYLTKVRATQSTAEYYRVLQEFCAQLKDGHTNVSLPAEVRSQYNVNPLFRTHLIEGRVLVRAVFDPSLEAQGVLPGVEVTHVNDESVKAYAEREIAPFQSASTAQDLQVRTYNYAFLRGPLSESPRVTFNTAYGESFSLAIQRPDQAAMASARFFNRPNFDFKMLPNDVAYVALNSFEDDSASEKFLEHFDEIAKASGLILDIRQNGGGNGNVGFRILSTLTDKAFKDSKWLTRTYKPTFRAWGRTVPAHEAPAGINAPDGKRLYAKPVILLTSAATYSAAEDMAVAFDSMKRGKIFGEPTGGSTGQPLSFKLPGGGSARVCTKLDSYADGKQFVGVGVQPHKLVRPTVADIRAGKDTVLLAALEELAKNSLAANRHSARR